MKQIETQKLISYKMQSPELQKLYIFATGFALLSFYSKDDIIVYSITDFLPLSY